MANSTAFGQYRATPPTIADTKNSIMQVDVAGNLKTVPASDLMAQKVTVSGDITYIALAPAGTAQSAAAWRAYKVTVSGADTTITWADSNTNFDNVATDLTALTYA